MAVQNSGTYTLGEKVLFYFLGANNLNAARKSPVPLPHSALLEVKINYKLMETLGFWLWEQWDWNKGAEQQTRHANLPEGCREVVVSCQWKSTAAAYCPQGEVPGAVEHQLQPGLELSHLLRVRGSGALPIHDQHGLSYVVSFLKRDRRWVEVWLWSFFFSFSFCSCGLLSKFSVCSLSKSVEKCGL